MTQHAPERRSRTSCRPGTINRRVAPDTRRPAERSGPGGHGPAERGAPISIPRGRARPGTPAAARSCSPMATNAAYSTQPRFFHPSSAASNSAVRAAAAVVAPASRSRARVRRDNTSIDTGRPSRTEPPYTTSASGERARRRDAPKLRSVDAEAEHGRRSRHDCVGDASRTCRDQPDFGEAVAPRASTSSEPRRRRHLVRTPRRLTPAQQRTASTASAAILR